MTLIDDTLDKVSQSLTGMVSDLYPDLSSPTMSPWRSPFFQGALPSPVAKEAIPTGVPFIAGDEHADRRAHSMGVDPQANMDWLRLAKTQIGAPYVWGAAGAPVFAANKEVAGQTTGGTGLDQFDCSGFAQWVVKRITGQTLSHHAATQATETQKVGRDQLRPGDLLFFSYGSGINHVEIYMGGDKEIGTANEQDDLGIHQVDWNAFVQGGRVPGMGSGGVTTRRPNQQARAVSGQKAGFPAAASGPLTVPFSVQPQNYFTGALLPIFTPPTARQTKDDSIAPPPGNIKAAAKQMVLQRGGTVADYNALVKLWNRESGWDPKAVNQSSGATGIPQLLPSAHDIPKNWDDPMVQITWGLDYIFSRYGSPSAAWQHSQSKGWY